MYNREKEKKIEGYCIWCKLSIYSDEFYVINELGELLHKFCDSEINNFGYDDFEPEDSNFTGE